MNYYELLEITPNASKEVIKAAYKAQVAKYHPDNVETGDIEKVKEINIAYETLSDPEKKKQYDEFIGINNATESNADKEYTKAGMRDTAEDDRTENYENKQHMEEQETESEIHRLKWFVSFPVIIIATVVFFPAGILLFILRCIFLLRDKTIYHRKRKVCSTWIVIGICVFFVWGIMSSDTDTDKNTAATPINQKNEEIPATEYKEDTEIVAEEEKSIEKEITTEQQNSEEKSIGEECDPEIIHSSAKQYAYYENPYYIDGLQVYVDFLNEIYKETDSGQQLEITSLDQILKEAGLSKSFRKKIAKADSQDVFKDSDFVRMDTKQDKKIFSSKPEYYEVSSKDKTDIQYEQSIVFYMGKLKDNKPNGEGAIFSTTETGTRLAYAGEMKEGRPQGKGVLFVNSGIGGCVNYIGDFKDGNMDGKGTMYDSAGVVQTYNNFATEYKGVKEKYFDQYTAEQQNDVMKEMMGYFQFLKMSEVFESYTANESIGIIKCNYPVIRPTIKYQGSIKDNKYDGKGTLYGGLSTLWYDGEFKNGTFHGNGTLYYALTGVPEYKGEFKNGKYNGKGTLYNEDGSIRKKGQFKKEEPDANQETQEIFPIDQVIDTEKYFEKAMMQITDKYNLNSQGEDDDLFYYDTDDAYEDDNVLDEDEEYNEDEEYDEVENEASEEYDREYILPASEEEPYTEEDLESRQLSAWECRIARNEIYARHGKIFQDEELQKYFESMYWYEPNEEFSEDELSNIEQHNLETITNYEKKMGYR